MDASCERTTITFTAVHTVWSPTGPQHRSSAPPSDTGPDRRSPPEPARLNVPVRHRSAVPRLEPRTARNGLSGCLCGISRCGGWLRHFGSRHRRLRRHTGERVADRLDTTELSQENRRGETDHDRSVGAADLSRGTEEHRGTRAHAAVQQRGDGFDTGVEVLPKPWRLALVPRLTVPTPIRLPVQEPGVYLQEPAQGTARRTQHNQRRHIHNGPRNPAR